jgi:hypothetical protein
LANRGSPSYIDQLIDCQPRLFDQIDHRQQALPVATEKLRQSSDVRWPFRGVYQITDKGLALSLTLQGTKWF